MHMFQSVRGICKQSIGSGVEHAYAKRDIAVSKCQTLATTTLNRRKTGLDAAQYAH